MRLEYKYVVPMERLDGIRRDILHYANPDSYASRRENSQYTVRSIYFDTPRLDAYREKVEGIRARKKLRIRTYNEEKESGTAFLEIKTKLDQRGMKHRAAFRVDDLPAFIDSRDVEGFILPGRNRELSLINARRFHFHLIRSSMRPVVLVTYEREAYQGRFDETLRITFDKHLRFLPYPHLTGLFQENALRYVAPRFFIMEIKFNTGFSPWLQAILRKHGLRRISISKYGSSVLASDMMRPMFERRMVQRCIAEAPPLEKVVI